MEDLITFGSSDLDRGGAIRNDPEQIAQLLASGSAGVLAVWRGKLLINDGALVWLPAVHPIWADAAEVPVFLGHDTDGPRFARDISSWEPPQEDPESGGMFDDSRQYHPDAPEFAAFQDSRPVMTQLSRRDGELAATARSVLQWHGNHRFCANCGAETQITSGGWQRKCSSCSRQHFPRTDPVVIMLITNGNSVLLGRSPAWPEGFYSLLAGFIEPGETVEAAVRREVFEEAGVRVGKVRYVASQPWPYPSSLMMGCRGEATTTEINIDPVEIADARWVSREDMAQIFAGDHPEITKPRHGAIAYSLIEAWLSDRMPAIT